VAPTTESLRHLPASAPGVLHAPAADTEEGNSGVLLPDLGTRLAPCKSPEASPAMIRIFFISAKLQMSIKTQAPNNKFPNIKLEIPNVLKYEI
jgi:hypothetical protein